MLEKEINGVVCLKKFVKMYDIWTIGREDGLVLPAARTGLVNHLKNTESGIKIQITKENASALYVYIHLNIRLKERKSH